VTIQSWINDIHQGDAAETLAEMPESSVHMTMTSPPYFGLRDYGVNGQIGLEDSLDEYIDELLNVASELRRVLRDDASWWLNLGDSFAGSWGAQSKNGEANNRDRDAYPGKTPARTGRLRRKSKMLVPHRVAIALEDAGWIIRADCPWVKPNPMPHPVTDRLHEHKEFVFHMTPEPDYYFELDPIRESHKHTSLNRIQASYDNSGTPVDAYPNRENGTINGTDPDDALHPNGKNPGDVFEITVKPFPEAHFAVYPPELCETPIKSSCPPAVCTGCGTPHQPHIDDIPVWEQDRDEIEREQLHRALDRFEASDLTEAHLEAARAKGFSDAAAGTQQTGAGRNSDQTERLASEAKDVLGGYFREFTMTAHRVGDLEQVCDCDTDATEPGIVLDPFAGAGTTCMVAKTLGRRFIGIDLNPDYVALAQKRVGLTVDEPERLLDDSEQAMLPLADGGT
jgi:DNA modification methylase